MKIEIKIELSMSELHKKMLIISLALISIVSSIIALELIFGNIAYSDINLDYITTLALGVLFGFLGLALLFKYTNFKPENNLK